jgi:hypothetical protein
MSISFESPDRAKVRERLQSMSDEELIRYGRASRKLRNIRGVLKIQWEEARAEWRRRHRKWETASQAPDPRLTQPVRLVGDLDRTS